MEASTPPPPFPMQVSNQIPASVDATWLSWGEWSHCSLSCGNGNRNRGRGCTGSSSSPIPCTTRFSVISETFEFFAAPAFHGQHCSGSTTETEHCNTDPCPGEGYVPVVLCKCAVAASNFAIYFLLCHFFLGTPFLSQSVILPVSWSAWTRWSPCSRTCGTGQKVINYLICFLSLSTN